MRTETPTGIALTLILVSASLATFMSSLDGTIVNITLPTISESFGLSPSSSVAWVSTIYLFVMVDSLLIIGKKSPTPSDSKKIFLAGFAIFTISSFTCGFLPEFTGSFETPFPSHVLQTIGGAIMTVVALALLSTYMPRRKTGKRHVPHRPLRRRPHPSGHPRHIYSRENPSKDLTPPAPPSYSSSSPASSSPSPKA